ncbi:hypothetical protein CBR_g19986 [Chara braunii]|uniref:Uncharacterized protein n=1 Tax=Chara braunii TaxID=69332 RepID=A0A388KZH4_CHABU|nr:hypothetical protein CBR_g19986 [Chara braunii]|eukprot:GBG75353.1 hypothetical protein CBR_g19986 [Chara braunii]
MVGCRCLLLWMMSVGGLLRLLGTGGVVSAFLLAGRRVAEKELANGIVLYGALLVPDSFLSHGDDFLRLTILLKSLVDNVPCIGLDVGLGYVEADLRDVVVYVTKMHDDVPNVPTGAGDDIVDKIVQLLLLTVAAEHDGRMAGLVEWGAILDEPLSDRYYMHGEMRADM